MGLVEFIRKDFLLFPTIRALADEGRKAFMSLKTWTMHWGAHGLTPLDFAAESHIHKIVYFKL
jgi:hypothetical protein